MPATDDPFSPRHAEPAQAQDRPARARSRGVDSPPEPPEPRAEIVETPGLRWIHIERPRAIDQAWLEEHFDFHALDYEDVFSRNQRPKVDEYDDYLFIVLHFPRFDKTVSRLNAAEVDIFVGPGLPDHAAQRAPAADRVSVRPLRSNEELRENMFSKGAGYLLYKIVDDSVDASFPMLRKMGNKLERIEEDIFEGEASRGRARHLQRQAGDHQLPQGRPPAARRASATSSAPSRATSPRTSTSTSTTSSTRPSASGTCSRTTRRSVEALEDTNESAISHRSNEVSGC